MEKKILNFWKLCELSDFEKFTLQKESIKTFNKAKINSKKNSANEYKLSVENKKTTVYKVYLGLIKSENVINYIYQVFKENNLLKEKTEQSLIEDLEKLKTYEYTYMAYVYLNSNLNLISIENESLVINPIFYIVYNILHKKEINNNSFNEFLKEYNLELEEKYKINNNSKAILIPDYERLLELGKYPDPLQYLSLDTEHEIILFSETIRKLKESNENSAEKILNCLKKDTYNIRIIDRKFKEDSYPKHLLNGAVELAHQKPYDFIYLYTKNKININTDIPDNLYLTTYLKKEKFYVPPVVAASDQVNEETLNKILSEIQNKLSISGKLFHKDGENRLFYKQFKNIKFKDFQKKLEKPLVSFYIESLNEEPKKLTMPYIRGKKDKCDVNSDINIRKFLNSLDKFKNTNSRWASSYPLNYAQQAAVNMFLYNLNGQDNIFSVNGPPGTGKTTLLKDVIANIITKKIKDCIKLDKNLFNNGEFNEFLCRKYEILVTSNNNAAVENITVELPKQNEFDFEYLNIKKEEFLLSEYAERFYGFPSWNFITAKLGNKKNVTDFLRNFEEFVKAVKSDGKFTNSFLNNRYQKLVFEFKSVLAAIQKDEELFDSFNQIQTLSEEIEQLKIFADKIKNEQEHLKEECSVLENNYEKLTADMNKNEKQIEIIKERKELQNSLLSQFGLLDKLIFKREEYKKTKKANSDLDKELDSLLHQLQIIEKQKNEFLLKKKNLKKQYETKEKEYKNILKKYKDIKKQYEIISSEYANKDYHINDDTFYSLDEAELQKSSLYNKDSYLKNKAVLFKISIMINEVLFLLNIDNFAKAVKFYLENYTKQNLNKKDKAKLQNSFSALFFLFPVVSTTLASSYNMLENIDEYGVLLCDEAGQATPQSLVGILNRANNALIVGDPLQVEPVFTAPSVLIKLLEQIHNIDKLYSPLSSSAQQLSDNANVYGSFYETEHEKIWVGMPLVVHRRCINPMFDISNKISYNNKMVLATNFPKENDYIHNLPESHWINVVSGDNDFENNSSKKEKAALELFLAHNKEYLKENYYIISPFKSVYNLFPEKNKAGKVGTVHTFQGKEADVVFFILGGRTNGAKAWAASKPNILNVAVTRARKRIYIIGDYEKWKKLNYFNVAAELLKRFE